MFPEGKNFWIITVDYSWKTVSKEVYDNLLYNFKIS